MVDANVEPQFWIGVHQLPDRQRALNRIDCALERGERLISGGFDEAPMVLFHEGSHKRSMPVPELYPGGLADGGHRGRAHDVGEHDRGQAAFDGLLGQGESSSGPKPTPPRISIIGPWRLRTAT